MGTEHHEGGEPAHEAVPGIASDYCIGVIMIGSESQSSFTNNGMTRFWDKLACGGYTTSRRQFVLIYDAKGQYSWIIYRLKGVTIRDLTG